MQRHTDVPFKKWKEVNKERKLKYIMCSFLTYYVFYMNSIIIHLFMYNAVIYLLPNTIGWIWIDSISIRPIWQIFIKSKNVNILSFKNCL